jgi:hypothetical protein
MFASKPRIAIGRDASSANVRLASVQGENGSASVDMLPLHAVSSSGWRKLQASTVERHGKAPLCLLQARRAC